MTAYEALSQRIVVRYHLAGLARDGIGAYLLHLLHLAGTELPTEGAPPGGPLFSNTSRPSRG
jgi:type II secretory pathway predicted ATPase ExeA